MSTPKKNAAAKKAETTTTQKDEGIGTHVVHHRALCTDKDGNTHEATPQEMAAAKGAYITVASRTEDGSVEVASTYDCRIKHYDSGNIGLFIRTSDSLDDAEMDNPVAKDLGEGVGKNDKIAFVGENELAQTTLFKILMARRSPSSTATVHMARSSVRSSPTAW